MHYEFMARLFPQQRPLIHFWTDVKKSVGQKWIYFGLAHQVVQEFRYRRFRVINRTLYTYFSICFYLCLITLEWIWNKSPVNRDLCLSLRNLIKHAIYFKRHLYLLYVLEKLAERDLFASHFFAILCGCIVIPNTKGLGRS